MKMSLATHEGKASHLNWAQAEENGCAQFNTLNRIIGLSYVYERPILGNSPEPHFLAKCGFRCGFHMKFGGFEMKSSRFHA